MLEQQPLAVNFGVLQGAELQGLITSMTTGPMRRQAPGRLLMIHTNQYLSDNQIKIHDFGMGEFGYKEDWCDGTIDRQQILVAFTLPGRAYILAERAKQSIKSSLNRHPSLKGILRRLSYRSSKPKK